jgi:protein-S-isoprenylcysteine O-methyltransferase Ste14
VNAHVVKVVTLSQKTGYRLLQEKVPVFKSPSKAVGIVTLYVLFFAGIMVFFWWFDNLLWYGPFLSQIIIVLISTLFIFGYFTKPGDYRSKYGDRAFGPFFFRIVLPMLIIANAGIFHVLLVDGPPLMPLWCAIILGIFFLLIRFLFESHIHRSGFDEVGHGLGIFSMFPEEGRRVTSEINSYVRHPMYAGDFCMALGLALLKNNWLAILTGVISFLPLLLAARLEDKELIRRFGEQHQRYVNDTHMFFPRVKDLGRFVKLLLSRGNKETPEHPRI